MRRLVVRILAALLIAPVVARPQQQAKPPAAPNPHPLPVIGASRERFEAVDAVTLGERIFVVERTAVGGWLHAYDASDVANPFELRDAIAPIAGRPLAVAGDGRRVLVASLASDTSRVRLALFDVSRADRSRWSGAASLPVAVTAGGVAQMYVRGDRAVVQISNGRVIDVDLAQLEREFAALTRGGEGSGAARATARALAASGTTIGEDALVPGTADTVRRGGKTELLSSMNFALDNQIVSRLARKGALLRIEGQWELDVIDAESREVAFTTRVDGRKVNSLTAPDGADVLVNDLVRVDWMRGRQLAVFNATIIGPSDGEMAWEGAAIIDVSDAHAPRVIAVDRRSTPLDTANLRYGWRPYIREAVFARDAIVELEYEDTRIVHFDADGHMARIDSTGRFAGRLVAGPDGTVLELSVESPWRAAKGIPTADTAAPALRIRTSTARLAMREAPAAIPVDEHGRSTATHLLRFEIVSPLPGADPTQIALRGPAAAALPAQRRGALMEAPLPIGTPVGTGALALAFEGDGASGRWIALGTPPLAFAANATRSVVALDDPFTNAAVVVADSGGDPSADAAFVDPRLRARLSRDSAATIFVVPGGEAPAIRVVRRDRGRADVIADRATAVSSYPASRALPSLAALRHLGYGSELTLALCLRDALGKRVKRSYFSLTEGAASEFEPLPSPPCGDAAVLRSWIARRGGAIVEGPDAAVIAGRREVPPADTLVPPPRDLTRWTRARSEIATDSVVTWSDESPIQRQGADSAESAAAPRMLPPLERSAVTSAVADVALLSLRGTIYTDSTDSTIAIIRNEIAPTLVADSVVKRAVLVVVNDGSMIYLDASDGRFIPRWEAWGYGSRAPQLIDLDGDRRPELVFTSFGHDAKAHVVSQELWAFDQAGRELTRQTLNTLGAEDYGAIPITTDVTDSEYCQDVDCGGIVVGRPDATGSRPLITPDGRWLLREGRYVFRPNPPAHRPAAKSRAPAKRAPRKPSR